jgi:nickel/cobalt exporter
MLTGLRPSRHFWLFVCAATAVALTAMLLSDPALAQTSPFGAPRTAPAPPDGIIGWLLAKQSEFYRGLSGAIRAAKADGSAVWGLLGLSFAYGVFHAAGPGHGKAVISSYVVANGETWRRGVVLSFASALLQALVAVAIVGVAAVLLGATAGTMNQAVRWIEILSYLLIAMLGLRLLRVKSLSLLSAMSGHPPSQVTAASVDLVESVFCSLLALFLVPLVIDLMGASGSIAWISRLLIFLVFLFWLGKCVWKLVLAVRGSSHQHTGHAHAHAHAHAHHDHDHGHSHDQANQGHANQGHAHAAAHDHAHDHKHGAACSGHHGHDHDHSDHASAWGHAHAPEPQELAGPGGWKRGLSAIVAVGLRPCSGAILVLVFALAQGLFWAGVASTFVMGLGTAITVAAIATLAVGARGLAQKFASSRPGPGMLVLRGLEVAAALLVLIFGVALLFGYIASERMFA